eukprot:3486021-Prymnesium_polylepis.1
MRAAAPPRGRRVCVGAGSRVRSGNPYWLPDSAGRPFKVCVRVCQRATRTRHTNMARVCKQTNKRECHVQLCLPTHVVVSSAHVLVVTLLSQTNKPPRGHVGRRHTRQTHARQRDNHTDADAERRRYQAASASPPFAPHPAM